MESSHACTACFFNEFYSLPHLAAYIFVFPTNQIHNFTQLFFHKVLLIRIIIFFIASSFVELLRCCTQAYKGFVLTAVHTNVQKSSAKATRLSSRPMHYPFAWICQNTTVQHFCRYSSFYSFNGNAEHARHYDG